MNDTYKTEVVKIRELTQKERREIKQLVTKMCANYDREYGCLPLDSGCYMLNKRWTGSFCKYFEESVLPLNSVLAASLSDVGRKKPCAVCGSLFLPSGRQLYCSTECRATGHRTKEREKKRRQRKVASNVQIRGTANAFSSPK